MKYSGNFRFCARTPTFTSFTQGHGPGVKSTLPLEFQIVVRNNRVRENAVQLYYNKGKNSENTKDIP